MDQDLWSQQLHCSSFQKVAVSSKIFIYDNKIIKIQCNKASFRNGSVSYGYFDLFYH